MAGVHEQGRCDAWLCPIGGESSHLPSLDLDRYLELLDWTGRQVVADKPGCIPAELPPILERLQIEVDHWVELVKQFGRRFRRVAGSVRSIYDEAARAGRRWLQGIGSARWAFGTG